MTIKDSGKRREFASGACRDVNEDKGRCDLLPLDVVALVCHDKILDKIDKYVRTGNTELLVDAIRLFSQECYSGIPSAMLEVAKHYSDGCKKYSERNWEKGIPLHCYIDSGVRHYLKWLRGDLDEPHERAFVWNLLGAHWTHTHIPELIDLPFDRKDDLDERQNGL